MNADTAASGSRVLLITGASSGIGAATARLASRGVLYALSQPPHVDVNELLIRPTEQAG
jgi:NADP-dependent 3-hydroxy acid dehydrogenase YdfG